jgi:cell division protein FtsW (lipid II flippase)
MWTAWTTVVVFGIALGQFFFNGVGWDRYAIIILILGLMGLLVLVYGPMTLRAARPAAKAQARPEQRLGEWRAGHPWCKTLP